jgi:uncharacterized Zn-finger protein
MRAEQNEDIMLIEINPAPSRERLTVRTPRQSPRPESVPGGGYLRFRNDRGVREICIGVKEFKCIGESPPQDHPHIYINMGEANTILCPYCGTGFRFDPRLSLLETNPPDSLFADQNAA